MRLALSESPAPARSAAVRPCAVIARKHELTEAFENFIIFNQAGGELQDHSFPGRMKRFELIQKPFRIVSKTVDNKRGDEIHL
jgi:hypothetical protein